MAAGYLFDKVGPKAPFVLIGVIDVCFVLIFCTFLCYEDKPV